VSRLDLDFDRQRRQYTKSSEHTRRGSLVEALAQSACNESSSMGVEDLVRHTQTNDRISYKYWGARWKMLEVPGE
jgi:hypothetical protein